MCYICAAVEALPDELAGEELVAVIAGILTAFGIEDRRERMEIALFAAATTFAHKETMQ